MQAVVKYRWQLVLAGVLLVALLLRLWGVDHGLPFVYNQDERSNFVQRAIGMFGHSYNPGYFVNPPAFTYLLHVVFALVFGGRGGVGSAYATDPTAVFVVARTLSALLGVATVWLLYLVGRRLFGRREGLLAAALMAVGFLPVFYAHLAVNDVPALAPLTLALLGIAGILTRERKLDWVLAGIGLGLACATKYTAAIVLLPLLVACLQRGSWRALVVTLGIAALAFIVANPYAVVDFEHFSEGIRHQSSASGDDAGKLGLTQHSGIPYYLWTLTWGLGWVPTLLAGVGAGLLVRLRRPLALLLIPAPLLFIIFMGLQDRYFGRWLLPIFPFICLLAAFGGVWMIEWLVARYGRRPLITAVVIVALLGQGLVYSLHDDLVLGREDTRGLTRAWMVRNIPEGSKVVIEPVVPDQWVEDLERALTPGGRRSRWVKLRTSRTTIDPDGTPRRGGIGRSVTVEEYESTLYPRLVVRYRRSGFCWVITGSTQSGRALADPDAAPGAVAYYRELERNSEVVFRATPYRKGADPVPFNFDWSFDYYPLAYYRPGPVMTVYRLKGCGGYAYKL